MVSMASFICRMYCWKRTGNDHRHYEWSCGGQSNSRRGSVRNFSKRVLKSKYVKEHAVQIDPQRPLSQLLLDYSWYNGSQILTFKTDQQIIGSHFQGSRSKRGDRIYGTYELQDETAIAIHIDGSGNHNPNIIDDYTYTVTKEATALQLNDFLINPPNHQQLQPVEKLIHE